MQSHVGLHYLELDQQNARLRRQLQARIDREILLQSRIVQCKDAYDNLLASSTWELQRVRDENMALRRELDVKERLANEAAREKEDMNDAVTKLIEKLETNSDVSQWPLSRLQLSYFVTLKPQVSLPKQPSTECSCPHAYTPAITIELQDSLERERRAHKQLLEESERRIADLRSRVASRDAELAKRAEDCKCTASPDPIDPRSLSKRERHRINERINAANRSLEEEVAVLKREVDMERLAVKKSKTSKGKERATPSRNDVSVQTDVPFEKDKGESSEKSPDTIAPRSPSISLTGSSFLKFERDSMLLALANMDGRIAALQKNRDILKSSVDKLHRAIQNDPELRQILDEAVPGQNDGFELSSSLTFRPDDSNFGQPVAVDLHENMLGLVSEAHELTTENTHTMNVFSPPETQQIDIVYPPLLPNPPSLTTTSTMNDATTQETPTIFGPSPEQSNDSAQPDSGGSSSPLRPMPTEVREHEEHFARLFDLQPRDASVVERELFEARAINARFEQEIAELRSQMAQLADPPTILSEDEYDAGSEDSSHFDY